MAAATEDTEELKLLLRGLLISKPTVIKANALLRDFEEVEGRQFPYRKLGYSTFVDYLRSIPSVVTLKPHNGVNPDVIPQLTRASQHIDKLVSRQRITPSKRSSSSRCRSHANASRPVPRRRAVNSSQTPLPQHQPPSSAKYPNKNVYVSNSEGRSKERYDEEMRWDNARSKSDQTLGEEDAGRYEETNFSSPALKTGITETVLDSTDFQYNNTDQVLPADLLVEEYEEVDYYEEILTSDEEQLSNFTINRFSNSLDNGESISVSNGNIKTSSNKELEEEENHISDVMIKNFRTILSKHPEGIWASELCQKYIEEYGVPLNFIDLGFNSAISLVSSLPSVFTIQRAGSHDWKLYDSRLVKPENLPRDNEDLYYMREDELYVPKGITENIKYLLEVKHPMGFRSTNLLELYELEFKKKLDVDTLGFRSLEDFLQILKKDITLRKVTNYYLLLPKLETVPFEAVAPTKPDEILKIPDDSAPYSIPDDVLRPGDIIPLQELPEIKMDPNPLEPLMELVVRVAEVISPSLFYIILDSYYNDLERMMDDLHKFYQWEEEKYKITLPHVTSNLICAHIYEDFWHRAKITGVKNNGEVEIEYIDYGTPAKAKRSELRYLHKDFATLPVQAFCAKLCGICPKTGGKKWPTEVCTHFLDLVTNKRLMAHVFKVSSRGNLNKERIQLEIVLYDTSSSTDLVLNDYLVEQGFAVTINNAPEESSLNYEHVDGDLTPATLKHEHINGNFTPPNTGSSSNSNITGEKKKPSRPPPGFEQEVPSFDSDVPILLPPVTQDSIFSKPQISNTLTHEQQQQQNLYVNHFYLVMDQNNSLLIPRHQMIGYPLAMGQLQYGAPNTTNTPILPQRVQPQIDHTRTLFNPHIPPSTLNNYVPQHNIYNPHVYQNYSSPVIPMINQSNQRNSRFYESFSRPTFSLPYHGSLPPPNTTHEITAPSTSPYSSSTLPPTPHGQPLFYNNIKLVNPTLNVQEQAATQKPVIKPVSSSPVSSPIPRPCTSLTPTSAEVANICYQAKSSSSSSLTSPQSSANSYNSRSNSKNSQHDGQNCRVGSTSELHENFDSNKKIKDDSSSFIPPVVLSKVVSSAECERETLLRISPTGNSSSFILPEVLSEIVPSTKCEHDKNPTGDSSSLILPVVLSEIVPLPECKRDMSLNGESLRFISPEVSTEIVPSTECEHNTSPIADSSSDDYESASENEEVNKLNGTIKQVELDLDNNNLMTTTVITPTKNIVVGSDIPDSWEDIFPDDSPVSSKNYVGDLKKPLDEIIKESESNSAFHLSVSNIKSDNKNIKNKSFLQLPKEIPLNWQDMFKPGEMLEGCEKKTLKEKPPSPVKFIIKKTPVQKLKLQGKFFHLLCVNEKPAVVACEFFEQFSNGVQFQVILKILEVRCDPLSTISKSDNPLILAELNKLDEFCGGIAKKYVIRLGKITIAYLTEIPACLKALNVKNEALLEDLKKISNEFQSSIE